MTIPYAYPNGLAPHQINEIMPETVGFHAWNPFLTSNSPSRSTMMSSHMSQCLVISGAELPYTLSGVETEYAKYTTSDRVPFNATVVQVIDRYPRGAGENSLGFNPETLVIVVDEQTGVYDVISVPYYKSYHQYFGYRNKLSDELATLRPGSRLGQDEVLGDTPGNVGGFHTVTTNLNCMLASADVVAEDSVLISQEALEKFKYNVYERRSASVGMRKFPVNIGRIGEYKCFPEIGDYTEEDGSIMFLRDYVEGLAPVMMSRSSTRNVNYIFDEAIYARQGHRGRIVDIKVIGNADTVSALPPEMAVQFERYRQAYIRFNEELLACERRIQQESLKKFGTEQPELSARLHSMLVTARAICDHKRNHQDKPLQGIMNKNPLDEFYIEFVVEYELTPTKGGKVTSINGDKGVITEILPRSRMPRDKDGNIADIVMGPDGTVARTNYARLYLMHFGATAQLMHKRLKQITGLDETAGLEDVEYMDDAIFRAAMDYLIEGYECANPDHARIVSEWPRKLQVQHIQECLETGPRFVRPVDCKKPAAHAALDLENFEPTCYGPVTHQLIEAGKDETTVESIAIQPLPIMLLDKTAEDTLTVGTAAHGPFGVLIKHNQADKYRMPWKDSPARTLGESEYRAFISHCKDPEMAADMMDRANNPAVQLEMARRFVESECPGGIEEIIDRRKLDYGDTRPLAIAANFFQCYGVRTRYIPEKQHL